MASSFALTPPPIVSCRAFYVGKPDERAPQIGATNPKSAYAD